MESHLFIKLYHLFTIQFLKSLIVVVVSPLVNIMKDQVDKLTNLGILAASLSEITGLTREYPATPKLFITHHCMTIPRSLCEIPGDHTIMEWRGIP